MKIISLQANNIKNLTAVSITPEGNVITLAGDNGAGKSSVLDSVQYAFAGGEAICDKPIRDGASAGESICKVRSDAGVEFTVHRRFTPSGSTLKITDAEGTPRRSPQALLDTLVGNLAFDPLSFARQPAKEQRDTLCKMVGIDFTALDAERARVFQERTLVNREIDSTKARIATFTHYADAPAALVDVAALLAARRDGEAANRATQRHIEAIAFATNAKRQQEVEVAEAEKQLAAWTEILAARKKTLVEALKAADVLFDQHMPKDVDLAAIDTQISGAETANNKFRANEDQARAKDALGQREGQAAHMTAKLLQIDVKKAQTLRAAKFPLARLSFDEEGVRFNGLPFKQSSSGEQLRVSVAVGMALNPKLRVIFIRDGSLLDVAGLKLVAEMAAANNFQVWMEDARSADPAAIVIEDGHVKGAAE